ncbi:MAG: SufS family cysteine desulfurase [Gemmatimonadota bacterium]|nr:SufS family cysteine desulfurase [Gemmatimonadota bacterium]
MTTPTLHPPAEPAATPIFDVARARRDFPVLQERVHGKALAYLDNGASSQRPRVVVEAEADYALREHANVHRGVHTLSQRATARYDSVRESLGAFLNAPDANEVIVTAGTTAGLNLVAASHGRRVLKPGDEILLTEMEHHSNIVPWQLTAQATGAVIRVIPVTEAGTLDLVALEHLLTPRTRIVALTHVSNVLGTVNPLRHIADRAHAVGAVVVVDGAQATAHLPVDVQALGCDFYVASAHKMYGPTGVGFVWGRRALLDAMPPWQGGGGMIQSVTFEETTYAPVPARFEAGTPPIAQVVGFGAALEYLGGLDRGQVDAHEADLLAYATEQLLHLPRVRVFAATAKRVSVLSFTLDGIHPHDVGTVLDLHGVAVRASHHCAQPLMRRLGVPGTVRASFGLYNTRNEVDALIEGLREVRQVFG